MQSYGLTEAEQKFGIQFPAGFDESALIEKQEAQKEEYQNFANITSTYTYSNAKAPGANVVGTVLNMDDVPVSGALISVADLNIYTDKDGKFQIKNMPENVYDWYVSAEGYENAEYLNYSISLVCGTNIFKFRLDPEQKIFKDRAAMLGIS